VKTATEKRATTEILWILVKLSLLDVMCRLLSW
jgi:hypothetical protein